MQVLLVAQQYHSSSGYPSPTPPPQPQPSCGPFLLLPSPEDSSQVLLCRCIGGGEVPCRGIRPGNVSGHGIRAGEASCQRPMPLPRRRWEPQEHGRGRSVSSPPSGRWIGSGSGTGSTVQGGPGIAVRDMLSAVQQVSQAALRNRTRAGCALAVVDVLALAPAGEGAGAGGQVRGVEGLKGLYLLRRGELILSFCCCYSYIKVAAKAIKPQNFCYEIFRLVDLSMFGRRLLPNIT
mmetsp:Transcript_11867/g.26018  ORF Transcript_11867/g.26018 Transcript_11867/m.26018 type:complete len:235 (-) Transcript_11867:72-776(-)